MIRVNCGVVSVLLLGIVCSPSCSRPQRFVDRYAQTFCTVNGQRFHTVLEYVRDKNDGQAFAVTNVERSDAGASNHLDANFMTQTFQLEGRDYTMAELSGKMLVWENGEVTMIPLAGDHSLDAAKNQALEILDKMNHAEGE